MIVLAVSPLFAAKPKLGRAYQEFLDGPTSYLLTRAEKDAFKNLTSDTQRDDFIERFWEVRNPHPGTGQNDFKEEFYRRVAWANSFYGRDAGTDGWRTDRGRTYILFGRPQTSMSWPGNQELRPIELWFYSNPGLPELPPFFYVLFYAQDDVTGYHFYHPYIDGPDKLVRSAGQTPQSAYNYLRGISVELATASLSLIPGEPIDTDTYSGSMASAAIIRGIQGYAEMPSYGSTIRARLARIESVTSRIEYDLARTNLLTFLAMEKGEFWLHWQLQVLDPKQPKSSAGRVRYKITARLLSNNKLVFERTDAPDFAVPPASEAALPKRPFLYEDRIPIVQGRYRLEVKAENLAAHKTYEAEREVLVAPATDRAELSDILVLSRFEPDKRPRPFDFGGVKLFPSATGHVQAVSGLRIFYQVILPTPRPPELKVEYIVGSLTSKVRKTFEEPLDMAAVDQFHSLITAKTLPLDELGPGSYQLAVRIKDPQTGRITAGSVPFTITAGREDLPPIVVSQGRADSPQWVAANQYERALCWLSQGNNQEAISALKVSWQLSKNQAVEGLLRQLQTESRTTSRDPNLH